MWTISVEALAALKYRVTFFGNNILSISELNKDFPVKFKITSCIFLLTWYALWWNAFAISFIFYRKVVREFYQIKQLPSTIRGFAFQYSSYQWAIQSVLHKAHKISLCYFISLLSKKCYIHVCPIINRYTLAAFQNTYVAITENFEALMFYHTVHIKIVMIQITPPKNRQLALNLLCNTCPITPENRGRN